MDEHSCEGNGTRSIHQGIGVLKKVGNVIIKLMEGWKTRLEIIQDGKILTSRMINISQDFLQGDSDSPVIFSLTEEPASM